MEVILAFFSAMVISSFTFFSAFSSDIVAEYWVVLPFGFSWLSADF